MNVLNIEIPGGEDPADRRIVEQRSVGSTAPGRCLLYAVFSDIAASPHDAEPAVAGEEISLAARAFTHGYDLYCPNENLIWHLYDHDHPKHWDDHDDHRDAEGFIKLNALRLRLARERDRRFED